MTAARVLRRVLVAAALSALATMPAWAEGGDIAEAWAALQRGNPEATVGLATSAIAGRGLTLEDLGAAYNLRGMAFMKMEDFANAEADFNVATSLIPAFASALTNRGLARAKLERYGEAIVDFDQALAIVPGEPEILFMRGNARFDTNDFVRAVDDYAAALKAAPQHWMALMNRCDALGKLGRLDEAKADCAKARPLAPDAEMVERILQALGPCDCKPLLKD